MKQIDVIRPGSLSQIIGPAGTLKRIIRNSQYFNQRGYSIDIFTYDSITSGKPNVIPILIKANSCAKSSLLSSLKRFLRANLYKSSILSILYIKRSDKRVKELIKYYLSLNRNPNYVVFHSVAECFHFLKNSKNSNIKTACFFHSDGIPLKMEEIYYPKLKGSRFFRKLREREEFVVRNVNRCVFIADHGRNNFLSYYSFINRDKTSLILNGIEDYNTDEKRYIESFTEKSNTFKYRFCCCGTINSRKGHNIIIEAVRRVDKKVLQNLHFTFVGDGPERILLEEIVDRYKLSEHFTFTSAVDNSDIYKYLLDANIYILMSKNEGLPISIIEALRAGLPVISTKIAGIPELVNQSNGILIDPDVDQLVTTLNDIDKYDWKTMGGNSRQRFLNEFTFDRMKKEYCDMIDSI